MRMIRDYTRELNSRQEELIVLIDCIFLLYVMAGVLVLLIIRLNEGLRRISPL